MSVEKVLFIVPLGALTALCMGGILICWIRRQHPGNEKMREIAHYVREGAFAYLKQQYKVVGIFFAVVFCILIFLVYRNYLVIFVPFAFLSGGFFSALAGFVGMWISTHSASRTAQGCTKSLNRGLKIALASGEVMGLTVVGLGLLDLSVWYWILNWYYSSHPLPEGIDKIVAVTSTMLCFGMGASSQALFARLGGGIYTKAADVGADLVGKIEAGIPEDDPRNPAVIADQVGDNVGDVAGMGADLYESYVDSIVATMTLASVTPLGMKGVSVPMIMAACGIVASILGFFLVRTKEDASQKSLLRALRKGIYGASIIVAGLSFIVINAILGKGYLGVWGAVVTGLIAGIIIGFFTEYFTSSRYKPTRQLSKSALTGPATVIIEGMSLGMLSTVAPIVVVCLATLVSFFISGGMKNYAMGLYGVGISAVGMLSTLGITLATDAYGPVADNAGGNAEMASLPPEVREKTDQLDALGNTTAATGKGFAIGSAALTALALIVAYNDHIHYEAIRMGKEVVLNLTLLNPVLLIGLFLGAMMPFLFCSLSLRAVGRAAGSIIEEVRRQFRDIKGILEGKSKPDYSRCVKITTKAAQKEMLLPSLMVIVVPVVVGVVFGASAIVGLLVGALATGFALAVMMANAGGGWDNAKKYIEEGNFGGKGSEAHKAAVVGDTVGDPFKDTSGPSLNILIKLMSMVSIVFSGLVISLSLFR